jgi:hypothetical protein
MIRGARSDRCCVQRYARFFDRVSPLGMKAYFREMLKEFR